MFTRTANATLNNVSYNTQRVAELAANGFAVNMEDSLDLFVNGNVYNVEECESTELFESSIDFDVVDTTCTPVLVYLKQGRMVAWYDEEQLHGYVNV